MNFGKWALGSIYYYATIGVRSKRVRALEQGGRAPISVIVFHRIADDRANAWTTSTADFTRAIGWLRSNFELISLSEAQRRIGSEASHKVSVCVTFDDGYAENCDVALPLLVEQGIPCTYFVTTQPVLEQTPFPHDVRMGRVFKPNTIDELRSFAGQGIDIGAHTRTHPDVGQISDSETLFDEVVRARDDLQEALGKDVRYFAFPFGGRENLSAEAFELARQAGYAGACSAYGDYNFPGGDAFHLQRRCVDGSLLRVKNWVTMDPFLNRRNGAAP